MKKILLIAVVAWLLVGWQHSALAATPHNEVYAHRTSDGQTVVLPIAASRLNTLTPAERKTVQPSHHYHSLFTPTDPYWPVQWNLVNMNLPSAWDATATPPFSGSSAIVVAVLDTGVAYENTETAKQAPDLAAARIWTNAGEVGGDGVDNDANGFVDDAHGWNFISNTAHPDDDNGHGTHVADTIAGGINNGTGIAGIAPNVTIMPVKVLDSAGVGKTETIANGIRYAMANGANIINLSLGGTDDDPLLASAVHDAEAAGILVIAAAGNDGGPSLNYPARYAGVIAVGAVQYDQTRAPYSNSGTGLTIMAPGGNLDLDQNGDGQPDGIAAQTCTSNACTNFSVQYYEGTSQAAAQVSGVLALVESCGATAATATNALTSTASDGGVAGYDTLYGHGVINAAAALASVGCVSNSPAAPTNLRVLSAATSVLSLSDSRAWPYKKPLFRWAAVPGLTYHVQWGKLGATPTSTMQPGNSFQPTLPSAGTYRLILTATDAASRSSSAAILLYRYRPATLLVGNGSKVQSYSGAGKVTATFSTTLHAPVADGSSVNTDGSSVVFVSDLLKSPSVFVFSPTGSLRQTLRPFGKTYTGGLNTGIVHSNSVLASLVVASTTVGDARWVSSDGSQLYRIVHATDHGYSVATGDLNADGTDEVVLANRRGSAVYIYSSTGKLLTMVQPLGKSFHGGWVVAAGDLNSDGKAEIALIPADARKNPTVYILNSAGHVTKSFHLTGVTVTQSTLLTVANTDGASADRLVIGSAGASTVTTWNVSGKKIGQITLAGKPKISSLAAWE